MILRRIASAFRRQDWFTVFVETMIVVTGVFIDLQVNNWNEARKDRVLERQYLMRIANDLESTIPQSFVSIPGYSLRRSCSVATRCRLIFALKPSTK